MLFQLTQKCNEGCPHCFVDASPDKEHMSDDVFERANTFLKSFPNLALLVSGGEPTLHPNFYDKVMVLKMSQPIVMFLSNGSFLSDYRKTSDVKKLISEGVTVQIRTHPLYYPNYKNIMKYKSTLEKMGCLVFDDAIDSLVKLGRTKTGVGRFPGCTNFALAARQLPDITKVVQSLEARQKLCTPVITVDGGIHAGETQFCYKLGSVDNTAEEIYEAAKKFSPFQCDRCEGCHVLTTKYPEAVRILK